MAKTETIRVRVEPEVKKAAEAVFAKLGLSASEAVTLFYRRVEMERGIPFELKIPNRETVKALEQVRARKGLKTYNSIADFRKSLGLD